MMVWQISLLLLLAVVGFRVTTAMWGTNKDKKLLSATLHWLQGLDRGYAYKEPLTRKDIRSATVESLEGLVQRSYKELHCGFAFFAMLHMRYTKDYLTEPGKLSTLSDRQVKTGIVFTKESATMLAVMYEDNDDHEWDGIAETIWLFHMYAEMVAEFVRKYRTDENKPKVYAVVDAHDAVDMLLADFVRSNECIAYDPETKHPVNISSSSLYRTEKKRDIRAANAGNLNGLRWALKNRRMFWRQYRHNAEKELTGDDPGRLSGEKLHLNYVIDDKQLLEVLRTAFDSQLDWDPILESLERTFRESQTPYGRLTFVIGKLIRFQNDFVDLLKAIALRIAAKHFLYMGRAAANAKASTISTYNQQMARLLTIFAHHVGLNDDDHLKRVIDMMTDTFVDGGRAEERVQEILGFLQDVSRRFGNGVRLAADVAVDGQSTKALERAVRYYGPVPYILMNFTSVPNSLLYAKVFVGFVQKITRLVDFQVINWFGQLKESKVFDCFRGMEYWFISYPKNVLF